jgi:hypothetical protein
MLILLLVLHRPARTQAKPANDFGGTRRIAIAMTPLSTLQIRHHSSDRCGLRALREATASVVYTVRTDGAAQFGRYFCSSSAPHPYNVTVQRALHSRADSYLAVATVTRTPRSAARVGRNRDLIHPRPCPNPHVTTTRLRRPNMAHACSASRGCTTSLC